MSSPPPANFNLAYMQPGENDYTISMDKAWIIITGTNIFAMMVGFAFLEAGSVRKKNSNVVFYKIMLNSLIIVLTFWTVGYALAFGDSWNNFIGGHRFYAGDKWDQPQSDVGQITQYSHWVLQYGVATVVVAITNGSISERTSLKASAIQAFLMTLFIYPVAMAWTWGQGWLANQGFVDFAGSAIVHCTGAYAGLAGLIFVGPRYNKWDKFEEVVESSKKEGQGHRRDLQSSTQNFITSENANENEEEAIKFESKKITQARIDLLRKKVQDEDYEVFGVSNLAYVLFGGLWLWMGFVFYNAGSTIGIMRSTHDAWIQSEKAAVNTFIAGAAAGILALAIRIPIISGFSAPRKARDEAGGVCNAYLAGMVACGAGMNLYEPWAAFVAGLFGGLFYIILCKVFDHFKIDDACEAFQLHGGGGTAGTMLFAFLNPQTGILYGNPTGGKVFGQQLLGWVCIASWSFITNLIIWLILKQMGILRVDLKTEIVGYDYIEFAEDYDIKEEKLINRNGKIRISNDRPITNQSSIIQRKKIFCLFEGVYVV